MAMVTAVDLAGHDLSNPELVHDNYQAPFCRCWGNKPMPRLVNASGVEYIGPRSPEQRPPAAHRDDFSGRTCANCGNTRFLVTGSCHTCATCGNSDGCG